MRLFDQTQCVAANCPYGDESQSARHDRGDVGDHASPHPAKCQHRGGEKDPTRDLNEIAEGEQRDEQRKPAELVMKNGVANEGKVEVVAKSGRFEDGQEDHEEEHDSDHALVAPDGRRRDGHRIDSVHPKAPASTAHSRQGV